MEKNYSYAPHQSNINVVPFGEQSKFESKTIFPSSNLISHTPFSILQQQQQAQTQTQQQQTQTQILFQPQPIVPHSILHSNNNSNNNNNIAPLFIKSTSPPLSNPSKSISPPLATASAATTFPKLKKRPYSIDTNNLSDDEESSISYNIVEVHPPFSSTNSSQYSPHSPNYSSNQSSPPLQSVNSPTSTPTILCGTTSSTSVNTNQIFTLQQQPTYNGSFTTLNREKKYKETQQQDFSLNSSPEQTYSSSSSPPGSPQDFNQINFRSSNSNLNSSNSNITLNPNNNNTTLNTQSILSLGGAVMPNEQDTWIEIRDLSSAISKIAKSSLTCGITEEILNEIKEKGSNLLNMIETVTQKEKLDRTLLTNDDKSKLYPPLTRPRRFRKKKNKMPPGNSPICTTGEQTEKTGKKALTLVCTSCGTTQTPEWRKGPAGGKTLCNACGLHYAKLMRKEGLVRFDQPNPSNTSMNVVNLLN